MALPVFLNVGFDQRGEFVPLHYENIGTRLDNVKFEKERGTLVITDVRIVWYKKRGGGGKSFLKGVLAATAVGIAGSIAGDLVRNAVGGWAGSIADHAITSAGYAATSGIMFNAMSGNDFMNFGKDGKLESLAIPLASVRDVTTDKKGLTIILESGDTLRFEAKNVKALPAIKSMIIAKKNEGKCPYCGAIIAPGNTSCQSCGAPVRSPAGPAAPQRPTIPTIPMRIGGQPSTPQTVCPTCGKRVPSAKFCCECGAPMGQTCPNCGESLPAGIPSKFCPNCGGKL